ncbi:glycosyltransferase [Halalkalibacillus halophilus]|uniref:glycosyltransferase n=1 Tax=Halalkalibacillus halophilus TaxID=392827 RepID=UPI00040154DB|nr:glycosyltransferase [Halalkalibacillus halophilus]
MKIVHILPLYKRAGAEVLFINNLVNHNKNNKFENYVIGLGISEEFKFLLQDQNIKYIDIGKNKKQYIPNLFKILNFIKSNKADVIYGQNLSGNILATFLGKFMLKKKVICHERGGAWLIRKPVSKILVKFWVLFSDKIFCNSNASKRILELKYGADKNKIKIIHNGAYMPNSTVKDVNKKKKIVFVGRLEKLKSPATVIEVINILKKEHGIKYECDIIGDGPLKKELESLKNSYELDNIRLLGSVNNVKDYLEDARYMILPSIREPFGNVLVESALNNVIPLATKIDGIPEVVKDGETGILFEPQIAIYDKDLPEVVYNPMTDSLVKPMEIDPYLIVREILNLDSNFLKREAIIQSGYKRAYENFTISSYNERLNYAIEQCFK